MSFEYGITCGLDCDIERQEKILKDGETTSKIRGLTIEEVMSGFKTGIGLDISKNHTGVVLWRNGKMETYGFAVAMDYDKDSYLAEAKMRVEFKDKLYELLKGERWEICAVEDVYGGASFDTIRKLLALNCVIDELVFERKVEVEYIYRLKEPEWIKYLKQLYKAGKGVSPKIACQEALGYLHFDFYEKNFNLKNAEKQRIFFEDICDATGQLIGLAVKLKTFDTDSKKKASVALSNITTYFLEDISDLEYSNGGETMYSESEYFEFPKTDVEQYVKDLIKKDNTKVYIAYVSTSQLGTFGLKNGFTFYEQGYGYLVFYTKEALK